MTRNRPHIEKDQIPDLNNIPTNAIYSSKPLSETIATPTPVSTPNKIAAVNDPKLVRKTYYYTNDLIKAISVVSALQGKDKSQLVREILMDSDIIKEYMEKIKSL